LLLQRIKPADELGNLRLDAFRRDRVADVFCGVSDPLLQLIDGRRELRPAPLGLSPQFLNGSRHGRHRAVSWSLKTNSLSIESFLAGLPFSGDAGILCKLGAEEEDLRGIVRPEHQNDQRAGRARVSRRRA
jgi:hypothetical protein